MPGHCCPGMEIGQKSATGVSESGCCYYFRSFSACVQLLLMVDERDAGYRRIPGGLPGEPGSHVEPVYPSLKGMPVDAENASCLRNVPTRPLQRKLHEVSVQRLQNVCTAFARIQETAELRP